MNLFFVETYTLTILAPINKELVLCALNNKAFLFIKLK